MFYKSVTLSNFRDNAAKILEVLKEPTSDKIIQILHRNSSVKVLMTQEHYFRLLEKIEGYEGGVTDPVEGKFDVDSLRLSESS